MSSFPRDDYRSLERYAPDRRPVAVDLSDNTNRWGPHPAALEVLRGATPDDLTRYPSVYADELRSAIARRFGVEDACVVTGCGSDDLLDSTFRAVAAGPGRVAYPGPTFSMIPVFARMNGLDAVAVDWATAAEDPGQLLASDPDAIYVCSPNNPTGATLPEGWLDALLEAGGADGPVVLLDEAYTEFSGESRLSEAPATARLLVLRTLSKAYGLAGLRIGFAVGPSAVVAEVEKSRGPYKIGRIDEAAAIRALDDPAWIDDVVARTVANRERLIGRLEERGHSPLPSEANFVLLPVAPATAPEVTAALRERGVAVRPFPELPEVGDAIRITVGPWRLLERFLDALDEVLRPEVASGGGEARGPDGRTGRDPDESTAASRGEPR